MKEKNKYFCSFNGSSNKNDYLKYGLLNDRGFNFDFSSKTYNEDLIMKSNCNLTKDLKQD